MELHPPTILGFEPRPPQQAVYQRSLHTLALLTACATFPLIFMGGLVTSYQAGMSVPDWPNSYGYNMFLFPPNKWVGGIFYEHTHRLMGTVVGLLAIVLVLKAWGLGEKLHTRRRLRATAVLGLTLAGMLALIIPSLPRISMEHLQLRNLIVQAAVACVAIAFILATASVMHRSEPRRWVRWLTIVVLAAVIIQGVLGGLRVVLVKLDLAIIHACFAQAFFCLAALMSVVTSRWWIHARNEHGAAGGHSLVVIAVAATVIIYAQLIAGAVMRHYQAGLAVPDFPMVYGKVFPPAGADELAAVNHLRIYQLNLPWVTLGQIWVHYVHRILAVVVTVAVTMVIIKAVRMHRAHITRAAMLLLLLILSQLTLGALTVILQKPADIASLHVAVGALTLMTTFIIAIRAARLYSPGLVARPEFKRVGADASVSSISKAVPA